MATLAQQQHTVLCAFLYPPRVLATSAARTPSRATFRTSRRNFSQTTPACDKQERMTEKMRASQRKTIDHQMSDGASFTLMNKQQIKSQVAGGQQDFDIGLFPGTFIMPSSSSANKPSLFSRDRWRLEYHRAKIRVMDVGSLLYLKFFTGAKPRPKLALTDTADVARRLHYDMWSAFAAGDEQSLRRICSTGVLQDLLARIGRRRRGEGVRWTLHQYNGRPAVASHRAAQIPDSPVAIRQAVVRIRSRQSLEKTTAAAARKGASEEQDSHASSSSAAAVAKDVDEYLVIQRSLVNGKVGDWFIWGTTQESDVERVLAGAV